jgi:hypothetical protein
MTPGVAGDRIARVEVAHDLAAYVPRVQLSWLATKPERRWRETDGTLVFA